jgi:hypothetical protein
LLKKVSNQLPKFKATIVAFSFFQEKVLIALFSPLLFSFWWKKMELNRLSLFWLRDASVFVTDLD